MATVLKEIRFLAVARKRDKQLLASRIHTPDKSYDYVAQVMKVLNSSGWASVTTDKLSLDDGPYMFYVLIDQEERVYIAITTKGYPSRLIYGSSDGNTRGVLTELKRNIQERYAEVSLSCGPNALNSKLGTTLKALCDEFNDLKQLDKITNAQAKVDAVTTVMQKNIEMALKNTDRLEDVDEKAVQLAESANKFRQGGAALKRKMQWRYIKMVILFTLLIAAVLTIIIVPLVLTSKK